MPDNTGLEIGLKGSKGAPMPGTEGRVAKDLKKAPASLEESNASRDEDPGGGPALTGKKRKDRRGSADDNRNVTRRVLRSDAMKLRAEAEAPCGAGVEVSKTDSLERKHCDTTVEAEACKSSVLMEVACNGGEANGLVNLDASDVSEESTRCSDNNMGMPGVPATDFSQDGGLAQGSIAESDDKTVKSDEVSAVTHSEQNDSQAGINSYNADEAQDNKVRHGPCQDEVIDSAITNGANTSTDLTKTSPTSGSESVKQDDSKQENNLVHTEGVILHSGDPKVENHSQIEDTCTETEISLTGNGRCAADNHTDRTGYTKQEERGSPVNETNDISAHDIVFTRRGRKSCEAKQGTCEEESRFEKRVTRSATVRQREVSGSLCKTTTNETALGSRGRKGDIIAHYTRKVSSAVSPKGHHAELGECNTSMENQTVKQKVVDRRDSGATKNDNDANDTKNKESEKTEINLKTQPPVGSVSIVNKTTVGAVSVVGQSISGSAITERNDTDHTDSDGVKYENMTLVQKLLLSVGAKIVASKKRVLEAGPDKTTGRSPIALPSMKKTRNTSSDPEIDQPDKSSGEKLIGNNCDLGNKRVLRERQHQNQTYLSSRSSNQSNQNAIKQTQDQSDDDDISSDTSYRRTRSGRRRGAARLAVPKQEDSSDSEEVVVVKKNRRKRKKSVHKHRAGSKLKHTSGSPPKTGRLGRPPLVKSECGCLPLQPGKGKMNVPEGTGALREEKQKISDQIKAMLLDAGWTIDLRPRNGRNYMDSVYIHPSGKGSYWSVTKAYYVFRADMESEQKESSKDHILSKKSVGSPGKRQVSSSSGCTLTDDILSKLKRVVVNKRTTKVEIQRLRQKKEKKNTTNSTRLHLGNERKKRGGCALLVRGSNKESGSTTDGFVPYEWKRTIFSWLIDLNVLSVNTKLNCLDESHSKVLLEGFVTRDGINCSCCSEVISVPEFVTHAGSEVNKPYRNILVDGLDIDLLHCLINAWNMQSDAERQDFFPVSIEGDDPNDDTCGICGDGGNLICCDGCPSTFHMSCLGLEALPTDYWCCSNCSCKFCHEHSSDDAEDTADVDSSLHTCSQCEEQYHGACSPDIDSIATNLSSQTGNLFCQQSCRLLFEELQNLLAVKKDLEPEYSCRVVQRIHEEVPEEVLALDKRVECNSKIAVALSLMDECFLPIVDQRTGINLIRNVVYNCGSNFARLDFRGFYIIILERGDEIIAAASVRWVVSSCFLFLAMFCFVTV
ncbi:Acyl-CoA N-acyltransferase with RING/FYVE/PHD-type zinc finger protein [Zea mays]|uniref:Acyl-CoA N-acyltransferase with RING/FYVE/PHD-type zinc finger protein n=2 Tax=Zea mays TaxID=4577 RepID=A0A1D6GHL7_MAIZE|nr:Acyl-CoA N-acyltransferase with RING/FYVE/PHD-type zinc finger protein [Zea mays]AQK62971.1 Acyl-CoA N-acyltransferase with RING/FYVE/PHD-type zinc finger protein [Zea mays]